jgi:hypothetical protein
MVKRFFQIMVVLLVMPSGSLKIWAQQPAIYEVAIMPFNMGSFSEISPVIVKDGIIFCSDRRFSTITDRTAFDGNRLYNIYFAAKKDSVKWGKPEELKSERSTMFNNGPLCLANDGKTVYFTSEIETGAATRKRDFKNHSGIFVAGLSGTTLKSIRPFKYNNSEYEVAQPSISSDGKYLFFASDMPGGQGKSDLWYCESINGEWSTPVNLGPKVNSSGSDNYPYMHPSGRLYFTSDRPGGPGKLDVYFTSLYFGEWEDPALLPEPINSAFDDFALVAEDDLQTGYFASNRRADDDIYRFNSKIIRKASCDSLAENNYCYRFLEENAIKYDTIPFRYEWKFSDGAVAEGATVDHCFSGPGKYYFQLDVINLITNEIMEDEKTDTLIIEDVVQPYITGPDTVKAGQQIILNAGETNLPGWNISRYYWNFDDETIDQGVEVPKKFIKPGTYNIQLIVTDEPQPGGMIREACVSKNIIVTRQP